VSEPRIFRVPIVGLAEPTFMECVALVDGATFIDLLQCPHAVRSCIVCTPLVKAFHARMQEIPTAVARPCEGS
jgi:hypothetical protein